MSDKKWKSDEKHWNMLRERARSFRKEPTQAEDILWQRLRGGQLNGVRFRRQHVISRFVVDFCCASRYLIIELDGSIHRLQQERDRERQELLESLGYQVIRFTNDEVLTQIEHVLQQIKQAILENTEDRPHPTRS